MGEDIAARGRADKVRIWDAPVRLFHWALVLLIAAAWWTAEERILDLHRLAGYSILTLILFRIVWGFIGSDTTRFSSFVRGPVRVARYVAGPMFRRGAPPTVSGHNPLGGWSVVAMLALLLTQVLLGFISVDVDGIESGPFAHLVDFDTGRAAAEWHEFLFNVLLAVIALHVAAVLFYLLFRRDNLIMPMFTGARAWAGEAPSLRFATLRRGAILFAGCAALVWLLIAYASGI